MLNSHIWYHWNGRNNTRSLAISIGQECNNYNLMFSVNVGDVDAANKQRNTQPLNKMHDNNHNRIFIDIYK